MELKLREGRQSIVVQELANSTATASLQWQQPAVYMSL